ncbi:MULTISPECIES: helix-turn-helix transcriptional regulator [unclassified Dinoroseobacter]|uniref:helix-turn-helix transcriptional regulator n=1 Tax=unclassified Dinoroseobacter TaxID=2620028 RepID=UPI003C7C36BD
MTRLETYMKGVAEAEIPERIWDAVLPFSQSFGIDKVSYHHNRGFGTAQQPDTAVFTRGFPNEWVCTYVDEKLYEVDPIPAYAAHATQPFRWSDIGKLTPLKQPETEFLKRLMAEGLGDGLALQVFGPNMRNGYVGVGFAKPNPDLSAADIRELQAAAQVAHLRYCTLVPDGAPAALTPREAEVLTWIARGKSNSVIADILGVSPHTVDTLVRRIYGKLEVADRTTAAIHGIGAGLIQPSRSA